MFDIFGPPQDYRRKPKAKLWTIKGVAPNDKEQELINARLFLLLFDLHKDGKLQSVVDPEIESNWHTLSAAQKQAITIKIYGLTGKFFTVKSL